MCTEGDSTTPRRGSPSSHRRPPSGPSDAHLMHLRDPARVEEDALRQRGLPRVDVGRDADVADPLVGKDGRGAAPAGIEKELGGKSRFAAEPCPAPGPQPFCHPPPRPPPSPPLLSLPVRPGESLPPTSASPQGRSRRRAPPSRPAVPDGPLPGPRHRSVHGTTHYLPLPAAPRRPHRPQHGCSLLPRKVGSPLPGSLRMRGHTGNGPWPEVGLRRANGQCGRKCCRRSPEGEARRDRAPC